MKIIETHPREIGFVLLDHCQNLLDDPRICMCSRWPPKIMELRHQGNILFLAKLISQRHYYYILRWFSLCVHDFGDNVRNYSTLLPYQI